MESSHVGFMAHWDTHMAVEEEDLHQPIADLSTKR